MNFYEELPLSGNQLSIRLLEIEFDACARYADDGPIHVKMKVYEWQDALEYTALSYTWGTLEGLVNIKLNGQCFPVTPNLHAALQNLRAMQQRNSDFGGKLWIDAICINQSDNQEKSRQVMRMKDVYANASKVLVWIGLPDDLSGIAFETLKLFAADDGTQDGSETYRDILDTAKERRAAIQRVIERPYFDRVWIIQEIVVARKATLLCGSLSIPFDMVHIACGRMTSSGFLPFSTTISKLTDLGTRRRHHFVEMSARDRDEAFDLRILIMDTRSRSATELRDKVYALRGIASNAVAEGIKVDYDKSVERVYTDCAKHLLSIRPDLRVLSGVKLRHRFTSTLCLPSWVPDWTQPDCGGGVLNRYYRFAPASRFCAAGTSKPRLRVTVGENSDTICLAGARLDTVLSLVPIKSILNLEDEAIFSVTEQKLREMALELSSLETYPFTNEPFWKVLFRTLTADRTALSPRIDEAYRAEYLTEFHDFNIKFEDPSRILPSKAWDIISKSVSEIIEDKVMFLTARGYVGLGQEGFQPGDIVCILSGGEVPFLLRQLRPQYHGTFHFLGECYVHGVMDGEEIVNLENEFCENFLIE